MGVIPDKFTSADGKEMAAFASRRIPAWHMLGTVINESVTLAEFKQIANLAGLNERKVHASELMARWDFAGDHWFVIRNNPFTKRIEVLASVGGRYEVFTTDELFNFAQFVMAGAYRPETAGAMDDGRKVFLTMVHPDDIILDPNGSADVIKRYLATMTTHDGTGNVIAKATEVRVVCQNTWDAAVKGAGNVFKLRHTASMRERMAQAQKLMGFAADYDKAFEAEANKLFAQPVTDSKFWEIVESMYPKPDDKKGAVTRWSNNTDGVMQVWNNSTGSMQNLPKNGWRALNALTETMQWQRTMRSDNVQNWAKAGGFDPLVTKERARALEMVKVHVGIK